MIGKPRCRSGHRSWVTYERSYLVTLGLAFLGVTAFVGFKQGSTFSEWSLWAYAGFFGLLLLGLWLLGVGFLASRARIDKWADWSSRHEASLLIMVLAFPVFLLMCLIGGRDEGE